MDKRCRWQRYTSYITNIYVHIYTCEIFVCFRSNLLVWALLDKTLSKGVDMGRSSGHCVVEVWVRSKHCISRGVRSKFFFRGEWILLFPWVSLWGLIFVIRTYDSSCFMHGAQPVGARTADNFRTLCADGSTDDRNRQQQQECREYQLAAMLHDVLYLLTVALSDPGIRHRG